MNLEMFESKLRQIIGDPTTLRPFVCEGSPLDCKVFIVGSNPATPMRDDWWTFWRPGYGFDKEAWYEAYLAEYKTRPLKPGRTKRLTQSPTRARIDWVGDGATPMRCLETNLYPTASPQQGQLTSEDRNAEAFDFVLDSLSPDVIVAHGNWAIAHLSKRRIPGRVFIKTESFTYGWSEVKSRAVGRKIKELHAVLDGDVRDT